MSRWFRHYAGMMRDDKLVRVALKSKQPVERVVWVWGAILESAAEIDDGGRYELDCAEVSYFLRADEDDIARIEIALRDLGRLHEGHVAKWSARQFQSDRSAERTARYRDRHRGSRDGARATSRDGGVTSQEQPSDAPETETETETEKKVTPPSEELPRRRATHPKRAEGVLCPTDLAPDEGHYRKVVEAGHPRSLADSECREMISWSHANADKANAWKSDWRQALHGWLSRAIKDLRTRATGPPRRREANGFTALALNGFGHEPDHENAFSFSADDAFSGGRCIDAEIVEPGAGRAGSISPFPGPRTRSAYGR